MESLVAHPCMDTFRNVWDDQASRLLSQAIMPSLSTSCVSDLCSEAGAPLTPRCL